MRHAIFLALAASFAAIAEAVDWHFLTFYSPNNEQFTSLIGNMIAPQLPGAGVYYLWPGLQPTDRSGVYQNVLDGRSGHWQLGSGWCCSNPSLPWGDSITVPNRHTVHFSNTKGPQNWISTIQLKGTTTKATNKFPLRGKTFNQAVFAIELYGEEWTFGPLEFTDIVITSTGTDTSFCNKNPSNYNGGTNFTISGITHTVKNNVVTCKIAKLTLNGPNGAP